MSKEKKHINVSAAVNITFSTDVTGEVYHLSYEEAKTLYDELDKFFGADKSKEDTAQKNTHLPENPRLPENPYLPEEPLDVSWSGINYYSPFEEDAYGNSRHHSVRRSLFR